MTEGHEKTVPVQFYCMPDHDLDALLCGAPCIERAECVDTYCWTIREGSVPEHLVESGWGVCPICANTVEFKVVGADDGSPVGE